MPVQKNRFEKLASACTSCHARWSPQTFKHEITGMRLSETHRELDCESCHAEKNFAAAPTCAGCHDDKTYPREKPGTAIRTSKR
jgi:hypothetical protein